MSSMILLPFPVSVNGLYANVRNRGRVKTKRYLSWELEAALMLRKQTLPTFEKRVDLDIKCGGGRKNQDISNLIKCVEDTLVKHGVLIDDNKEFVRSVKASWDDETIGCAVYIQECEE